MVKKKKRETCAPHPLIRLLLNPREKRKRSDDDRHHHHDDHPHVA